jgi:WD40 repeat protein
MLAAADGKVVHVWSKNNTSSFTLTGHTAAVERVRFSADGRLLLAVLSDGKAFIWQMQGIRLTNRIC